MNEDPVNQYPKDHWLASEDVQKALEAYMEQQSKAYSRVKNAFIQELLGDLRGKRFLDYGCGAGFFSVYAAKAGAAEVVGVDALETALATASFYAKSQEVPGICSFVHSGQFSTWPHRPRFDVILMKDVLEHVQNDQGLLHAASKMIVPGGTLVVSTQNSLSLNYLLQGLYHRKLLHDKNWFGWDETHIRFYTPIGLNKILQQAGFRTVSWRSVYIIPYKLPALAISRKRFMRLDALSWIDKIFGGVFPYNRLGWNIVVKAKASPLVTQRSTVAPLVSKQIHAAPLIVARESAHFEKQSLTTETG